MEEKIRLQSRATEKYYEQIFEGDEGELEEENSNEALLLVQKKAHFDEISE